MFSFLLNRYTYCKVCDTGVPRSLGPKKTLVRVFVQGNGDAADTEQISPGPVFQAVQTMAQALKTNGNTAVQVNFTNSNAIQNPQKMYA